MPPLAGSPESPSPVSPGTPFPAEPSPLQQSPVENTPRFVGFCSVFDLTDLEQWAVDGRSLRGTPR